MCLIFPYPYLLILFSSEGTGGHGVHYLTSILLPSPIHTYQHLTTTYPDLIFSIQGEVFNRDNPTPIPFEAVKYNSAPPKASPAHFQGQPQLPSQLKLLK